MKRFQFRLNSLLRYREYRERLAQQSMAKAQAAVVASEDRIKRLVDDKKQNEYQLEQKMTQGIPGDQFQNYLSHLQGLTNGKKKEEQQHRELQKAKSREQTVLARRAREKKVLENLKSRRKDAYYEEMTKMLQKELDDMVTIRKAREINR